jgi:hypothetical protein
MATCPCGHKDALRRRRPHCLQVTVPCTICPCVRRCSRRTHADVSGLHNDSVRQVHGIRQHGDVTCRVLSGAQNKVAGPCILRPVQHNTLTSSLQVPSHLRGHGYGRARHDAATPPTHRTKRYSPEVQSGGQIKPSRPHSRKTGGAALQVGHNSSTGACNMPAVEKTIR